MAYNHFGMKTSTIVSIVVLVLSFLLILVLAVVIAKQIIRRQTLIGRPPVPVLLFILAKSCVVVNIAFLFLSGFQIKAYSLYVPPSSFLSWFHIHPFLLLPSLSEYCEYPCLHYCMGHPPFHYDRRREVPGKAVR